MTTIVGEQMTGPGPVWRQGGVAWPLPPARLCLRAFMHGLARRFGHLLPEAEPIIFQEPDPLPVASVQSPASQSRALRPRRSIRLGPLSLRRTSLL
jgi:hypothetical protein